jgi:hypothetical protein
MHRQVSAHVQTKSVEIIRLQGKIEKIDKSFDIWTWAMIPMGLLDKAKETGYFIRLKQFPENIQVSEYYPNSLNEEFKDLMSLCHVE